MDEKTEKKVNKLSDKLFLVFLELVEIDPEKALGIIESVKMAYMVKAAEKFHKEPKV